MNWYLEVWKKYAVFSGRARRMEYWMFFLFNFIIPVAVGYVFAIIVSFDVGVGIIYLYSWVIFIPTLAVTVRRLHDTSRSGWLSLIALVPFIGFLVLLIFMIQDSTPGENEYGANPKGITA
ncbi:MAG: DUF805 domain-containing protein [Zoogloeaceae bacterium]|nr:DUF805 domain-containing protein [Zoogloeaceae bacterium]